MGRSLLWVAAPLLISISGVPFVLAKGAATCQLGQVAVDVGGHCCWSGQRWDAARKACAGRPDDCPPGMRPTDNDCAVSGGPGQGPGKGPGRGGGCGAGKGVSSPWMCGRSAGP